MINDMTIVPMGRIALMIVATGVDKLAMLYRELFKITFLVN